MADQFHDVCGAQATITNGGRVAERKTPESSFDKGVVFSKRPLKGRFEVRIRRKVGAWSGSIRIGVTSRSPESATIPNSSTALKGGAVILSGRNVIVDGRTQQENYSSVSLESVEVDGRVGVEIRDRALYFYINGENQGKAKAELRSRNCWAVVDLYGQCVEVEIVSNSKSANKEDAASLTFHSKTGRFIELLADGRKAKRKRPLEEFNNAVILSNRPLLDNELFEIVIEEQVTKWSGAVEVGMTTHRPDKMSFPGTMTNLQSGTWMLGGEDVTKDGVRLSEEPYTKHDAESLKVGSRIGVVRKTNGNLHFTVDGVDQGLAARNLPRDTYAAVDLYGRTCGIALTSATGSFVAGTAEETRTVGASSSVDPIRFYPKGSKLARVLNDGKTAQRLKFSEEFNYGVVLTNRALRGDEIFEVIVDRVSEKWAGSIEVGVTTHAPNSFDFPSTMTNMRTGTWIMSGDGIQHDGTLLSDDYGETLDNLSVGDRVGVMRTSSGDLRFFINGRDQGVAASGLPRTVYGFVDMYGKCVQVSITSETEEFRTIEDSDDDDDADVAAAAARVDIDDDDDNDDDLGYSFDAPLRFHRLCGENLRVPPDGRRASRATPTSEFNNAVGLTSRPLRDGELFEVKMLKRVTRWSGSAEIGVTTIRPNELAFPDTMTSVDRGTWMLSGASVMKDGNALRRDYPINLDQFQEGGRIGVMRKANGNLHFYWNGDDKGVAARKVPTGVYGVVDVYGQCAEVEVVDKTENLPSSRSRNLDSNRVKSLEGLHCFHEYHGRHVELKDGRRSARRTSSFNNGVVLSSEPLQADEIFEISILRMAKRWSGSIEIGLTTQKPDHLHRSSFPDTCTALSRGTWAVSGSTVLHNGTTHQDGYGKSLDTLKEKDRVGVAFHVDYTMHVYVNGQDQGVAARDLPRVSLFAVVDLYGQTEEVIITSKKKERVKAVVVPATTASDGGRAEIASLPSPSSPSSSSLPDGAATMPSRSGVGFRFSAAARGKYVELANDNRTAVRTSSYNFGVVLSETPLPNNQVFQVRLDRVNTRWSGSVMIGVTSLSPDALKRDLPQTATSLKSRSIVVNSTSVFRDGKKIKEGYCSNLDDLPLDSLVGVACLNGNELHLFVDGRDQGVAARDVPSPRYVVVDVYGKVESVTIQAPGPDWGGHRSVDSSTAGQISPVSNMSGSLTTSSVKSEQRRVPLKLPGSPCQYQALVNRFFNTLAMPENFMDRRYDSCYCIQCHTERGDLDYYNRGSPPTLYAIPVGWCRLGLKLNPSAEANKVWDTHHRAYHGTAVDKVRPILDTGQLLFPGDVALGGKQISEGKGHYNDKWKPQDFDTKQIFLSPTIKYAGLDAYARKKEYVDQPTGKKYWVRVVFQVWICAGSYKVGKSTMAVKNVDARIPDEKIEWSTVERGATHFSGIVVKLEEQT